MSFLKQAWRVSLCFLITALLLGATASQAAVTIGDDEYLVFYHHDALGSPAATTNEKGQILSRESSQPFGGSTGKTSSDGNPLVEGEGAENETRVGYTGHFFDGGSELVYMKARFYDPAIGRFYSNDPVGFNTGNLMMFNRYGYANNNPYKYVDPDGRNAVTAFGGFVYESAEGAFGIGDGQANYGNLGGALADGYNGQGSGAWAAAGQDALEIGGALTGASFTGKIASRIAGFFRKSPGSVKAYRAVSKAEADDIAENSFRADPKGGSMEDKWFSESRTGAEKIRNDHTDLDIIVEADVPREVYDRSFKMENIDSSGPGFCVSCSDLDQITPL